MIQWHDDHYIDENGVRWSLECAWSPESVEVTIPDFLIEAVQAALQKRALQTPPRVTAAVTPPPRAKLPPGVNRYRIYIQGELPTFGHGWHTLKAHVGLKWVRLEDAKGRVRRIELDKFNLMNPEMLADDGQEQGYAGDVASAQDGDGDAA